MTDIKKSNMKEKTIELKYPRLEGNVTHLAIDLMDVRASDGIRISYDFDRDGWVIEQPKFTMVDKGVDKNGTKLAEEIVDWKESAFVQSWAREET